MSSAVAYGRAEPARSLHSRPRFRTSGTWRLPALSVLAFATLAMLAGLRFSALLVHPPFLRVAGIVAASSAQSAGLLVSGTLEWNGPARGLLRGAMTAASLYLGLRCAGVAGHDLAPWRWGSLSRQLRDGAEALDGLWPYRGVSEQARTAILACLPVALTIAGALVFWPSPRGALKRRLAALALLLGLYVAAAANLPRTGWQVQGLVALLALYLWGWSSRTRRAEDGRAAAWLLVGALVSILGAGLLAGGPLIDVRSWQPFGEPGATTAFNWNQTYGPLPWSTSPAVMAQVSSRGTHLWRATELDRFDGTRFLASGDPPAEHLASEPATLAERQRQWVTSATVTVHALASRDLLSPGQIISVSAPGLSSAELGSPAADGTQTAASVLRGGTRYTVTAYVPDPTEEEMRDAPSSVPGLELAYVELELPGRLGAISTASPSGRRLISSSPYAGVYALARHLAAGAHGPYEVVSRIESYLRGGRFTYDTHPPRSRYPIISFLTGNHLGYCQQFSAAMALMLRMDGIPARIGAGFLSGARTPGGSYDLNGPDAHAWVEVLFDGIGWVAFDPTPPQRIIPLEIHGGSELSAGQRAAAAHSKTSDTQLPAPARSLGENSGASGESRLIAALILAAGVALVATLLLSRARRRSRAAGGDADQALEELSRALARLDRRPDPGTTLAELERRLAGSHGEQAAGYVRSLRALRYRSPDGARAPSPSERRDLRRALTAGRGLRVRIRGLMLLPPRGRLG